MASSSNPMPLARHEGDLTLPQMPEYRHKRRDRRGKSSLRQFIHQAKTLRYKKSKYLAETASIKDGNDALPPEIPKLNLSGAMNPALVFGIQVSTLISRDRSMLQEESMLATEPVSLDSIISQRKRAIEHAKVVAEQLGKRSCKILCKKRPIKSSDQETEIFRFKDLPPEIREMVYEIYFTNSSGQKPGLLLAFKIDGVKVKGDFYNTAKQVYYLVNNWNFSIRDCLKNSILGNMDQVHVEIIRKMTIEIPVEIQACTKLPKSLSRAVNINELTLSTFSETSVRRAIHELLPGFKHLRSINLRIQHPKQRSRSRRIDSDGTEYYKIFRDVRAILDRVLSQKGKLIQENTQVQEWGWQTEGPKAFKITSLKKHIKFD